MHAWIVLNKIIIYVFVTFSYFRLYSLPRTPHLNVDIYFFYNILTLKFSRALLSYHDRVMCVHIFTHILKILGFSFISLYILFRSTNFLSRLFIFDLRMNCIHFYEIKIWRMMAGWKRAVEKAPIVLLSYILPSYFKKSSLYREELK